MSSAADCGYHVINNKKTIFDVFAGGELQPGRSMEPLQLPRRQPAQPAVTRKTGEIVLGETFNSKLNSRTSVTEQFSIYPNISNTGQLPLPVRHHDRHQAEKLAQLASHLQRPLHQRSSARLQDE